MSKVQQHFIDEAEARVLPEPQDKPDRQSPAIAWILAHYPGIEEGTEEWEQACRQYETMLEIIRPYLIKASLNNIDDRYAHALAELDDLQPLHAHSQPGIVRRLAYAHCVTVMEAFLLYSACALLNDRLHLTRFHDKKSEFFSRKDVLKGLDDAYPYGVEEEPLSWRGRVVPGQNELEWTTITLADHKFQLYKDVAQTAVVEITFHNLNKVKAYFDALLTIPPDWPLAKDGALQKLINTRQDLVHRNGMTKDNQPITITPTDLVHAVETVRHFITQAYNDLQAEVARFPGAEEGF